MKTTKLLGLAALVAVLTFNAHGDFPFTEADARNNAAVAASPRAREVFPWLTRTATASAKHPVNVELKNAARAKAPRVLEEHPELTRASSAAGGDRCVRVPELANRAFAASPRAKENFPHLRVPTTAEAANCRECVPMCVCRG